MALTVTLTDGTTSVSLVSTSNTGIQAASGGFGLLRLDESMLAGIGSDYRGQLAERYTLNLKGSSHDNAATQIQTFVRLLKKASQYFREPWQTTPVYLQAQTSAESNARYSLVFGAAELSMPDFTDILFASQKFIQNFGLTIMREAVWRAAVPGTLSGLTAITLTASDGPADPTTIQVANYRDDVALTHIFNYDAAPAWSANLYGTAAHDLWAVSGSTPAAGDIIYLGSTTGPWHHAVFNIGTAGVFTADVVVEYYVAAWTAIPEGAASGVQHTVYPTGTSEDTIFQSAGQWVLNVGNLADWAATTINGVNAWWIRIRLNSVAVWTTTPTNATVAIYSQKTPHVELGATGLKGDVLPYLLMRMNHPFGGDDDEGFSSLSRLIVGAKSRNLTAFVSHLNCATTGNPSGWTTTYGDDTSETATDGVAPRGGSARCTFATDASLDVRVTLTGDEKLASWIGVYRAFLRCQQIGGAAGDCRVKLRVCINTALAPDPKWDTKIVSLAAADKGLEVLDLGELKIPWTEVASVDGWGTLDLLFQIYGQRSTGASTLRFYDLILIPVDEWSATLDDPISNSTTGSSALRGNNCLEVDGGLIKNRTLKMLRSGSSYYPLETWTRGGSAPAIEPLRQTRLYFLMMHFPAGGTWGTGPMIATLGQQLDFTLYAVPTYQALRGGD